MQGIIEKQDKALDGLLGTLKNLHSIASTIGTTIDRQTEEISALDASVDRTQANLDARNKQLKKVAKLV